MSLIAKHTKEANIQIAIHYRKTNATKAFGNSRNSN